MGTHITYFFTVCSSNYYLQIDSRRYRYHLPTSSIWVARMRILLSPTLVGTLILKKRSIRRLAHIPLSSWDVLCNGAVYNTKSSSNERFDRRVWRLDVERTICRGLCDLRVFRSISWECLVPIFLIIFVIHYRIIFNLFTSRVNYMKWQKHVRRVLTKTKKNVIIKNWWQKFFIFVRCDVLGFFFNGIAQTINHVLNCSDFVVRTLFCGVQFCFCVHSSLLVVSTTLTIG